MEPLINHARSYWLAQRPSGTWYPAFEELICAPPHTMGCRERLLAISVKVYERSYFSPLATTGSLSAR